MKILYQLGKKENNKQFAKEKHFFVRNINQDYHTQYGFFSKEDLNKNSGEIIKSSKGNEFAINDSFFIDNYNKMKRGAAVMHPKDIGTVIMTTGLNKDSVVIDAGSGSGAMCCYLAKIVKKVYTYDIRDDHLELVKKNIDMLGLKNISIKRGDIYKPIKEKNADLLNLDVPEPWLAIETAKKALKIGGFISVYNPHLPQIGDFCDAIAKEDSFIMIKCIEIIEREWEISGRKMRPRTQQKTNHSGFLCFVRKIKN
jgi:tRNA (adenine57-N1/adenine58-N1)-methyltransferase catalytic subunit